MLGHAAAWRNLNDVLSEKSQTPGATHFTMHVSKTAQSAGSESLVISRGGENDRVIGAGFLLRVTKKKKSSGIGGDNCATL